MSKRLDKNAERKMYMEVIKEPLEDTLTDIIWTYMNTDHQQWPGGETIMDYPYASVFGLMLGFYVVLQLLHVADLCAHD